MAAKDGLTVTADVQVTAREIDFVTRFANNWEALRQVMGIMRPIRRVPGTVLKSKYAEVTLKDGNVGEGEEIPYSEAMVKEKDYATLSIEKYAKATSLEAINDHGYDVAVQMTDDQFLFELQSNTMERFYDYLKTGTLTDSADTFQMALALAQGRVRNRWKMMHKTMTGIVGFCNIMDAYKYLGEAKISVQSDFGMSYIQNFLGYNTLFLMSDNEIPQGKVIATPVDNIVLYYVSPADSDFARAGLSYRTDGLTNLIGIHITGNYSTAVSENFAIMGMTMFAEYLDGIANISFGSSTGGDSGDTTGGDEDGEG